MKYRKSYIIVITIFIVLAFLNWKYIDFLEQQSIQIKQQYYNQQVIIIKQSLSALIHQQQRLTMLIVQTIANNHTLADNLSQKNMNHIYFKQISQDLHTNSLNTHIRIQVIDKNLIPIYRSWNNKIGDNLSQVQSELKFVKNLKIPIDLINVGSFTIALRTIVPIIKHNHFIGAVEIISHFIKNHLLLNKVTTNLKYKDIQQSYDNRLYTMVHGNITVCYRLQYIHSHAADYFIMFFKPTNIKNIDFNSFALKWIVFSSLGIISLLLILSLGLYYSNEQQKRYYKQIIDLTSNIIIITNKEHILEGNKAFFKYFGYNTRVQDICMTNLFSLKKGYLQQYTDGLLWIDYILKHGNENHKAQIKINEQVFYFLINASIINDEKQIYSLILTDITNQERYQQKLQKLTITDALTGVKNRYCFNTIIESEIQRASRYKYPISLIMIDIDHFKNVNDKYGHDIGDKVLTTYTKLISSMLRNNDTFYRVGGEEFMIIVPYADIQNVKIMAEKIRKNVQTFKKVVYITMSFGIVQYQIGEEIQHLLKRADQALYKAKENGRNRVEKG